MLQGPAVVSGVEQNEPHNETYSRTFSTHKKVPWMVADYVITETVEQKGVGTGVGKRLYGEAQVDAFLCSDPECTTMLDIRTIIPAADKSNLTWCSGPPLSCLERDERGDPVQVTPRRAVHFTRLHLDNLTAIPIGTMRDDHLASFIRTVGDSVKSGNSRRHEIVWVDENPRWDFDSGGQYTQRPIVMPVGIHVRFTLSLEFERNNATYIALGGAPENARNMLNGFTALQVGWYWVHDLSSDSSGCAAVVLPKNKWMDKHGWNASDARCSGYDRDEWNAPFVFDSYFMQAMYLDKRVELKGTVNDAKPLLWNESVNGTLDAHGRVDNQTTGLLFDPELAIEVLNLPLQLNGSAMDMYGYKMGITWGFGNWNLKGDFAAAAGNAPGDVDIALRPYTRAGCVFPACRLVVIGTAVIAVWHAGFNETLNNPGPQNVMSFYQGLLRLKYMSLEKGLDETRVTMPWCIPNVAQQYINRRGYHGPKEHDIMLLCKHTGNQSAAVCSYGAYNCSPLGRAPLGFCPCTKSKQECNRDTGRTH